MPHIVSTRLFVLIYLTILVILPLQAEEKTTNDRVNFTISASMEVENDRLVATVFASERGKKTPTLAQQVNEKIEWGLSLAKTINSVTTQTLNYSTNPKYKDGKIVDWEVRQSIQLKSADSQALSHLLGQLQERLQISSIQYQISETRKQQKEDLLIAQAIADFKQRAKHITTNMDRQNYKLIRMNISNAMNNPQPYHVQNNSYRSAMMESAPTPQLQAGQQTMTVNIQAEIELSKN